MTGFRRFAWAVLAYNVLVIAWGGFVRATGSGAGCGRHWPTCDGVVLPRDPSAEMAIEFLHRATSGLALVAVLALAAWAFRAFPRGHRVRRGAVASFAFVLVEALVGAGIVLYGWVAHDTSMARAWAMPIHLTNTFLLLAALALTAAWSAPGAAAAPRAHLPGSVRLAALAVVLAGATGAIAALGDTLFPATSLAEGLRQELAGGAHLLLQLRVLHPLAAALAAVACVLAARAARTTRDAGVRRAAVALVALVGIQLAAGIVNLLLLAPVWMQIVHLVLADLLWIALVLVGDGVRREDRSGARLPRAAVALGG
jgi:cytochrome c oxidase assembly protein subunit 15